MRVLDEDLINILEAGDHYFNLQRWIGEARFSLWVFDLITSDPL